MRTLFYDNRHLLILTLGVILVGGVSSLLTLPRLEDPRINNRNPIVVTLLPGASAERVEALVTKKLEDELREVAEVEEIESDSRAGVSLITVELDDDVYATEAVFTKLRDKLADAEAELPPEASKPDFDDERGATAFTLVLGIRWQAESEPVLGVLDRVAEELADRLRNVRGTDVVRLYGDLDEEITVTVSPDELALLGLTVADVGRRVRAADAKVPAGVVRSSDTQLVMEVVGGFETLERVAAIPLTHDADGHVVRLSDVATVEKSFRTPPAEIGLVDGKRAVYVAARMLDDRRVDAWTVEAREAVQSLRDELSPGVEIVEVFDQSRYTAERLGGLGRNLLQGAGVVVLVILVTMGWRSSILVGLALPLVASMVLFALSVLGIPLHQMSIFGMIVAMGLLVDNAIVVVDEVGHAMKHGTPAREAISRTVDRLLVPLLGSTLTTVLAFLPIFLLPGNVGEFVGSIATTVVLSLVFSLFVSMSLLAALTGLFGRFDDVGRTWWREGADTPGLARAMRWALAAVVRRPVVGLLVAVALPVVGFLRAGDLREQFFPGADRDQFVVQVWLASGSTLERTRATAERVEQTIRSHSGVEQVDWLVGGSIPSVYYNMLMNQDEKPSYAQAVVRTDRPGRVRDVVAGLQSSLNDAHPEAQIVVKRLGQGPPVDAPVEVRVSGPSIDELRRIGEDFRGVLQELPHVLQTRTTFDVVEPKLWIDVDEVESRVTSLSLGDVAEQLQANLEGRVGGSVLEQTEELPVRIRFGADRRGDLSDVAATRVVVGDRDGFVPLSAIGDVVLRPEVPSIPRRNGERTNTVKAYVDGEALPPEVTSAFLAELERRGYELPAGYRLEVGGDAEERASSMGNLFRFAPVLGVLMLATVVLSFRSFLLAGLLGAVALLSVGLAFLNLWIAGYPLGFNPLIGTAGLIGIALNDSIVVLSQIRTSPRARAGDLDAVVDEVMHTSRHVFSTTLTTIGGFVPLLIAGGEFWPPLAVVIAGGVGGATILALVLVPSAYVLLRPLVEPSASTEREPAPASASRSAVAAVSPTPA